MQRATYWEYEARGGLLRGPLISRGYQWPLSVVVASPRELILLGNGAVPRWSRFLFHSARYVLPRANVLGVIGVLPLTVINFRIVHDVPDLPGYFDFSPRNPQRFREELRAMGYPVA